MSFDVYGRKPTAPAGENFQRSIWTWNPLVELCRHVNRTFALGLAMDDWHYNDGEGLSTQDQCDRLAQALQGYIETDWPKGKERLEIEVTPGVEQNVVDAISRALPNVEVVGRGYGVDLEDLLEWIEFLRHCGGFRLS